MLVGAGKLCLEQVKQLRKQLPPVFEVARGACRRGYCWRLGVVSRSMTMAGIDGFGGRLGVRPRVKRG